MTRIFLVLPLLATSALAATFTDVLNDLKAVDASVKVATTNTNNYDGKATSSLQSWNNWQTIISNIQKAQNDTDASPTPSGADTQAVLDYHVSTLLTDTKTYLTAKINKKSLYAQAGVLKTEADYMKDVRAGVDRLGTSVANKAYDAALNAAIAAFGG